MRILITGCNGQLGKELQKQLRAGRSALGQIPDCFNSAEVYPFDLPDLDISDLSSVSKVVSEVSPDIIFNCAAYTNVDGCEKEPDAAYKINAEGPRNLALAAEKCGAKFVHISTDYVFDGNDNGRVPRKETDEPDPISTYGSTKLAGERFVEENCSRYFVVRTAWLYSPNGKNFVKTIYNAGKKFGKLEVVNDQLGNPTNAEDLAYELLLLAVTEKYGLYHCTGSSICSWYDFACKIIEYGGVEAEVKPCSSEDYKAKHPESADRPKWSALDCSKIEDITGVPMRHWEDALQWYFRKMGE